ncbi:MAG: serine/threonine protein kinase [Candidatus Obscuribacterales bacterium]|nr:serine/threonine protein kinase [Candidatus Obscuribacterales bacterium]
MELSIRIERFNGQWTNSRTTREYYNYTFRLVRFSQCVTVLKLSNPARMHAHDSELLPGQFLDERYQITAPLGAGGMGTVYEAVEVELGRKVALKLVLPENRSSGEHLQRFRREAEALSKLHHRNIITIFRYGIGNGTPYVAMELLDGESLQELLERQHSLPLPQAIDIATDVASALSAAHKQGILHRDIKPGNIFLCRDGATKLIDFGLCKQDIEGAQELQKLTQTGLLVGSVHYMSPEACQGRKLSPSSDIYALGIVLYQSITGTFPFDFENPVGLLFKHVNDPIPSLQKLYPLMPCARELDEFFTICLAKNPDSRYQNAEGVKSALETLRQAEPRPLPPLRRDSTRIKVLVIVVSGLLAIAMLCRPEFVADVAPLLFYGDSPQRLLDRQVKAATLAGQYRLHSYRRAIYRKIGDRALTSSNPLESAECYVALARGSLADKRLDEARQSALSALKSLSAVDPADRSLASSIGILVGQSCDVLRGSGLRRWRTEFAPDSFDIIVEKLRRRYSGTSATEALVPLARFNVESLKATNRTRDYCFALLQLGISLSDTGRFSEAEVCLREVIGILKQNSQAEQESLRLNAYQLLVPVYASLGRRDDAIACAKTTMRLSKRAVNGNDDSLLRHQLVVARCISFIDSNLSAAIYSCVLLQVQSDRSLPTRKALLFWTLIGQARCLLLQEKYQSALELLNTADALDDKTMKDSPSESAFYVQFSRATRARLMASMGRFEDAKVLIDSVRTELKARDINDAGLLRQLTDECAVVDKLCGVSADLEKTFPTSEKC